MSSLLILFLFIGEQTTSLEAPCRYPMGCTWLPLALKEPGKTFPDFSVSTWVVKEERLVGMAFFL